MAKYIVEESYTPKFKKDFRLPMVNIIPAIVWSIPLHQRMFPGASWWMTFFLCAAFVIVYVVISMVPFIAVVPCVAGVVMLTALFWVFPDYISNTLVRIILKIVILAFFIMLELCIWINATLPWLERKEANKPKIRVEK